MKLKVTALLPLFALLLGVCLAPPVSASDVSESKEVKIQKYYDQAFEYYKAGDYGRAIQIWEDILRIAPDQKTARNMIREVQDNIEKSNVKRLAAVMAHIKHGRYRSALSGLETLLENGNRTPFASALQTQLESVSQIVPEAPENKKSWRLTVMAVNSALGYSQDLKLSYNGLRYAREQDPDDDRIRRLLEWFLTRHSEFVTLDVVTPGMTLLNYKRSLALDHMYGARYHQAIDALLEVLALEPEDLIALKRLGSAYFSLGLKDKARDAWSRAAKLDPADPQLKKFLLKLSTPAPGATK